MVEGKEDEFFLRNKGDCMLVKGKKLVASNEGTDGFASNRNELTEEEVASNENNGVMAEGKEEE